jgi:hypothetical protein
MIIVRLSGGLGNQMFQYATARRLAHIHGSVLKVDTSRLDKTCSIDTPREYGLDFFRITAGKTTSRESETCEKLGEKRLGAVSRFLRKFGLLPSKSGIRYYRQCHFHFDERVLKLPDNLCLDGYWQSEKYFLDIRDIITDEFTPAELPTDMNLRLAEQISECNSVSLHVRRGDYVANPVTARYHGACGIEYYSRAIDEIKKRVALPHLFVFSDDPGWTAANLSADIPTTFIDHNGTSSCGEDLNLMRLCGHNIIANSSFSWWGAWLNGNPGKTVIAPVQWFKEPGLNTKDLIPEGWLRI